MTDEGVGVIEGVLLPPQEDPQREYFHIVTRRNSGRTNTSPSEGSTPGPSRKRGRKPKAMDRVPVPPSGSGAPSLMVNERQRRKTSTRFSAFLEVLKGEREFYIEEEAPQSPAKRPGRRRLERGASPDLSMTGGVEDAAEERTCVIHLKEGRLGASVVEERLGGGQSSRGEILGCPAPSEISEEPGHPPPPPFSDLHIGEPLFGSDEVTDLKTFQISDPMEASSADGLGGLAGAPEEEASDALGSRSRATSAGDERSFRCKLCSSIYTSFEEASRHAKIAHSTAVCEVTPFGRGSEVGARAPFPCPECERCFPTAKGRDKHHLVMHLRNNPVSCSECGRNFNGLRPFERHLRVAHDLNPAHVCDVCDEEFVLGTSLQHHIAIAHPPYSYSKQLKRRRKLFQCPLCGRRFIRGKAFRAHHEKAHGGRAFECDQCKFKTWSMRGLKRHLASVHKAIDLSLYVCAQCKTGYRNPQELEEHYIACHHRKPTIRCPFCGDKFACLEMLRYHKGKHRAFPCDFCPVGFMKLETLEEHLDTVHKNDLSKAAETLFEVHPSTSSEGAELSREEEPPSEVGVNSKTLEIQADGSVEVKETPSPPSDEAAHSLGDEPPKVHHLHNTREGILKEMDANNPLRGFRLKDLPKKINCPVCGKLLTTKFLRTHMRSHQGMLPHKCPKCSKAYAQGTLLRKHMKNRHYEDFLKMGNKMPKKKKVQCEFCDLVFDDIYILEEHLWKHMDKKNYTCETCRIKFGMKINWMEHYKTHYFKEEKACPKCSRTFKSVGYFREHLEKCQSNWTCEECGLKCENPEVYRKHRKMEHTPNAVVHQCPHCEKVFYSKYGYHDHLITHSSEKQFACRLCDKEFKRQRPLNEHVARVHAGGSHSCGLCGLSFSDSNELRNHAREHRRLRLECGECGAVYLSRLTLDNHIAVHHSPLLSQEPFVCPSCAEVFSTQAALKDHLPLHSPETPFVCQVSRCHNMFRKEVLLRSHVARRHSRLEYFCHFCDRKFLLDSDLRKHGSERCPASVPPWGKEEHRPFKCVLCGFLSAQASAAVTHVMTTHGGGDNPLAQIVVTKWRCSLCTKLFASRGLLTKHLTQHAIHGSPAEGTLVNFLLSQPQTPLGVGSVAWDDLLSLTKVEVITQVEDSETGSPVRLATNTWQCPACYGMMGTEEEVRSHLGSSPACLEALVGLFESKIGTQTSSDLHFVVVEEGNNLATSTEGGQEQDPLLVVDNQLQLVVNSGEGALSHLFPEPTSMTLLQIPERKEGGSLLPLEVGEEAPLLGAEGGTLLQMEDGRLVISELGTGYQLVKKETNHQGKTELTYEILQDLEAESSPLLLP